MASNTPGAPADPGSRVPPSVGVAFAVFVVYVVAFIGLTATSPAAYDEWFTTGANAWRSAVLSLTAASVVLVAFLAWARWDHVFRDRERLWMSRSLQVPVVLLALAIVASLATADWGAAGSQLIVPILAAGALVGFAEETMFRGVILRALRANGRREAVVALGSSAWFGLFHLTNLLNGQPLGTTVRQVVVVTGTGLALYLVRRRTGSLVPAMVAHGLWDISLFLPGTEIGGQIVGVFQVATLIATIVAAVVLWRNDTAPGTTQATSGA